MIYESRNELAFDCEYRFVHRWETYRSDAWATLVIVHGLGDHGGRFCRMAEWLSERGVHVLAMDLVGHGRSPGRRGCIHSYDCLLDEVTASIDLMHRRHQDLPCFLFGQSMGGNLVINTALRRAAELQERVQGVIGCGSMLKAGSQPNEQFLKAGKKLSEWFPNFCVKAPVQVERLCRSQDAQEEYLQDRLVHRLMSLRLGISLIQSGQWAIDQAAELHFPTLLMHGAEDQLTSPAGSREFAEASDQTCFKIWDNLQHDLHFEPEWKTVLGFLRGWMAGQVEDQLFSPSLVA